ncbi:MAG: hypothetical protein ACREO2_07835, partial [Arenimonas sp.]
MLAWLALLAAPAFAQENGPEEMSRIIQAGRPKGELIILIAKTKGFSEGPGLCGDDKNCLAFDSHYIGKFHVEKVLTGDLQEKEIEVDFYYHTWTVPFYHADYALIFLRKSNGRLVEVKYQSTAIYKSRNNDWALCLDSSTGKTREKIDEEIDPNAKPQVLLNWIDFYDLEPNPSRPVEKQKRFHCKQSLTAEQVSIDFIKHDKIRHKAV